MKYNYKEIQLTNLIFFLMNTDINDVWKEIPETDGFYFVSNSGKVLSLCRNTAKLLKPFVCGNGYYYVDIKQNGRRKKARIHRLVAKAFLPIPKDKNKCIVHHKDHNKRNNNLFNLQWVTHQENI